VFRIAGIPVRVLPFFFIAAVMLGFGYRDPVLLVAWVALMFVGILVHELGHAFAYRAFGVQPEVVLHGFGGLTFGRSLPVAKDLVVSLAGPAVGLAIGVSIWLVERNVRITEPLVRDILAIAFFINFWWAIFNLLPILPMDGGNATNALLSLLFRRDMTRPTQMLSIITGVALIVLALYGGQIFVVLIVGWFIFMNIQGLSRNRSQGRWTPPGPPSPSSPPAQPQPQWTAPPNLPAPPPPGASPPPGPPTWGPMPDAPPVAGGPGEPAGTAPGFRPVPSGRTFGDEMSSATRSLATGQPELASLAVDRARRLAANADEHQAVDRLEEHVAERLADPST
jgi:Zn-dependent protease